MDTTFYEEQAYNLPMSKDLKQLKRPMTLDFNGSSAMKLKLNTNVCAPQSVLTTPDVNMLKLGTPEVVKLLIDQPNLVTTTTPTSTQILFPNNVTKEQESYVKGFVDALNELHHSDSSQGAIFPKGDDCKPNLYSFGLSPETTVIKDEPQTVPNINCSPPVSPIDMECQERIKMERKRQRNRIAASKCRKRKLERISLLEEKVRVLKGENAELAQVANKLKAQVCRLKEEVMQHVNQGCHLIDPGTQ
ncbi:transcription factor jun-D-like [Cimex lectularius]|uniref:BZIP domain-containing protein n=1 Tax=Cimex lectularius TaxID=79782 RepID=A0A8I6RMM3_CIMLE|nr:transcription factor jun-D-like [Cimex lectularius]